MILHLIGGAAEIPVSIAAIEINGKIFARSSSTSYQPGYLDACTAKLPAHIRYFRENCSTWPYTAVPYDWSSDAMSWVATMASKPFFGKYIFAPLLQDIMSFNNWSSVGEEQARWRIRQLIDHLGSSLAVLLAPSNEPDLSYDFGKFSSGGASVATALDRMVKVARITWEERGTSPVAILGPSSGAPSFAGGIGAFDLIDLLGHNGGEILRYLDGIDTHHHTVNVTRWHNFDGTPPLDSSNSPHHIGRVLAALGVQKPWTSIESGYAWNVHEMDSSNVIYRFGSHFYALLRYACSLWMLFCHAGSGADEFNISEATPPFAKRAWYDVATQISEPTQYLLPTDGILSITAKPSTDFNLPPWIVCAQHNSGGFPIQFGRVIMTNGNIHCNPGGRNIIARAVWLPRAGPRELKAQVAVSGGAIVKLCAYGYDKLNGLAESIQTITTSGTYGVSFTPRQHGNPLIPDPRYVLTWLDHNGLGTVDWSNISIT